MKNLLVIEDNKAVASVIEHLGTSAGYQVTVAYSFAEVKEILARQQDFFIATVDYSLPDAYDGEVIPYVLKHDIPCVIMTGRMDDKIHRKLLRLPIVDYITKENSQAYRYLLRVLHGQLTNHQIDVLVVDDSLSARQHICRLLKRRNFTVYDQPDGSKALQTLEKYPSIKLLITDQQMPGMSGVELTQTIRKKYPERDLSIIGCSGMQDDFQSARFIKNGANDFLKKPFCPEEFYCRVLQNVEFIESIETITRQANTDYLTGLYNRRYFFETVEPSVKSQQPQTLAMMDIDLFKSINDNFGHDAGDDVLRAVSALLKQFFGNEQVVARLGGEEFSVFFADMPLAQAETQLEAFRQTLADTNIVSGKRHVQCTMSIGVTHGTFEQLDQLLIYADELLYQAKQAGRNRVIAR